jgi:hypothetical protein
LLSALPDDALPATRLVNGLGKSQAESETWTRVVEARQNGAAHQDDIPGEIAAYMRRVALGEAT